MAHLALASVLSAITSVEQSTVQTDESIVEVGLQATVSVSVDGVQGSRVGHRDLMGGGSEDGISA